MRIRFFRLNSSFFVFYSFLSFSAGPLDKSRQLIVSLSEDWSTTHSNISFYERQDDQSQWVQMGTTFEANIGKKGLAWGLGRHNKFLNILDSEPQKFEGDLKAPAGVFDIPEAFGYHQNSEVLMPLFENYHQVNENSHCVDDSNSSYYNMNIYDIRNVIVDWVSDEILRRSDSLYEYAFVLDHNNFASQFIGSPGRGSCIFIHLWESFGKGTSGCTSMSFENMKGLMAWIDSSKNPRMLQLPRSSYENYKNDWNLP